MTCTRDQFYAEPMERQLRLDSGPVCTLVTPSDITVLSARDQHFIAELLQLFTQYRQVPGAHRSRGQKVVRA